MLGWTQVKYSCAILIGVQHSCNHYTYTVQTSRLLQLIIIVFINLPTSVYCAILQWLKILPIMLYNSPIMLKLFVSRVHNWQYIYSNFPITHKMWPCEAQSLLSKNGRNGGLWTATSPLTLLTELVITMKCAINVAELTQVFHTVLESWQKQTTHGKIWELGHQPWSGPGWGQLLLRWPSMG